MKTKLILLLSLCTCAITTIVSCHGNDLFINKEQKSIYSSYEIRVLYITINDYTYYIRCKNGHKGECCLRLDSIPNSYYIEDIYNASKNKHYQNPESNNKYNFLFKNSSYEIDNNTIGDAASCTITFCTDSIAEIL